jgi:hypothetical protein
MKLLSAAYPRYQLDPATPDVWCAVLSDIDVDALSKGVAEIVCTSRWFPSVAEVRDAAFTASEPERLTGYAAWSLLVETFGDVDAYLELPDPVRCAARRVGGWTSLAASTYPAVDRARFLEAFGELQAADKARTRRHPRLHEVVSTVARALGPGRQASRLTDGSA